MKFPDARLTTREFLLKHFPSCFDGNEYGTAIEMMQQLRGFHISQLKKSVTNITGAVVEVSGFTFKYTYTRQNLHFTILPELHEIYPGLKSLKKPYYSSFHCSGQGAISSMLLGLSQILLDFHLIYPSRAYYETPKALKLMNRGEVPSTGEPILFLDSTSLGPEHFEDIALSAQRVRMMVVDTSLWGWDEPLLQKIVNTFEGKKSLLLVRSHLKLDCLGGEYSTLGSLVYLPSDDLPQADRDAFVEQLQFASSSIGACPMLDQIYPFYKNPEFHDLTRKRISEIQDSLNRILDQLLPHIDTERIKVEVPHHRVSFHINFHTDEEHISKIIGKFIHLITDRVYMMDSYGFEFPTALVSIVRNDPTQHFIRMTGHVLGQEFDEQVRDAYRAIIEIANRCAKPLESEERRD
jgi:hypothetical protein